MILGARSSLLGFVAFQGFCSFVFSFLIQIRLLNLNRFWTVHSPVSFNSAKDGPFNFIWFNNKEHMQVISFYWCPVQTYYFFFLVYMLSTNLLVLECESICTT